MSKEIRVLHWFSVLSPLVETITVIFSEMNPGDIMLLVVFFTLPSLIVVAKHPARDL